MKDAKAAMRSAVKLAPYRYAHASQINPTSSSTTGYSTEIASLHPRQRPRKNSQLKTGTFSIAGMGRSHFGQRDRGFTTDNPAGHRPMHTFRNEPTQRPMTAK